MSRKQVFVLILVGIVLTGALMIALAATGNATALPTIIGALIFIGVLALPFAIDLWDDRNATRRRRRP